ncbi:hypothetical protein ACFO3O_03605 [Dokdonia ponticola]|uniref:Uncharacterized protein n=1 Tax=Dokdonia ponticola TaxID=2041041 RepID=A0ABV9HVC8_9FLAO
MEKLAIQPKKQKKKAVISFLIILPLVTVIICSIAVTFIHEYVPANSQEYIDHKKKYKPIIESRDSSYNQIIQQLENGTQHEKALAIQFRLIEKKSNLELKKYQAIKTKILEEDSYIGYTSFKNFLLGIGIRVFALVVSLFSFYLVLKVQFNKNEKKFWVIVSSCFILCSAYWATWSFIYKVNSKGEYDFERFAYDLALYGLPIIILIASYFIFKNKKTLKEQEEQYNTALSQVFDLISIKIPPLININRRADFLKEKEDTIKKMKI